MFVWDSVSLCSTGCLGTHYVYWAGLELRDLPPSALGVLGSKACTAITQLELIFLASLLGNASVKPLRPTDSEEKVTVFPRLIT